MTFATGLVPSLATVTLMSTLPPAVASERAETAVTATSHSGRVISMVVVALSLSKLASVRLCTALNV